MDLALNLDQAQQGSVHFGDLLFQNGDISKTADAVGGTTHPVLQDVSIRLRTYLGEYFINNQLGLPWHELAMGAPNMQSQLDAVIQNCILTTPGVIQLSSYSSTLDRAKRLVSISFQAISTQGPINYTTSIASPSATTGAAQ